MEDREQAERRTPKRRGVPAAGAEAIVGQAARELAPAANDALWTDAAQDRYADHGKHGPFRA